MKKNGANPVPQFLPGTQYLSVFIVSYMIVGQSSPVDIRNKMIKADEKFLKFIY